MLQSSPGQVAELVEAVRAVAPWQQLFLLVAVGVSVAVARRLVPGERWGDRLRARFVLGVPWGTLLTVLGVLLVYWVVQGGWEHPNSPLVIPFRSWSYFYPLGVLVAGFAHNGVGHITGNLVGTVVFAPVVEYYLGHYPTERGSESFSSLRANPFVRLLAVPAGSVAVGVFTGFFSMGPVIGFSGVVYAYVGFAMVTRPTLAVLALVSERVVDLLYRGLRNPYISREPGPSFFSPWWADIAIQGHAIGILAGVLAGIAVLAVREEYPNPLALWFAALVLGIRQSLWAIYAPMGANRFVLFRAVGVGVIFLSAALIATAVSASNRSLVPRLEGRSVDLPSPDSPVVVVAVALVVLSSFAVPFGFATVSGELPADAATVEVRDYTVTYVENEPNQYVSLVNEYLYGDTGTIRSSGVVVLSEERRVWIEAISKSRLAFSGGGTVRVGGLGWRESVHADREGWSVVGNGSVYKVSLREQGGRERLAYASDARRARPVIDGRNVSIAPVEGGFEAVVSTNGTVLGRAPVPARSNATTVGGLTLNRTGRDLVAISDRTRVQVASKSVPRARQG
ncbi:rhomboid family intramembrane serine protease [Halosimplex halophilum]|uniref:rhomboid family intramembrane serine protease n=1 Tax=Halosimplex halophilum TaxID=2559572 RepID=UPI00107F06C1|nr:rhomboid family intramembrane serine protease [Halosimplex halophilum]